MVEPSPSPQEGSANHGRRNEDEQGRHADHLCPQPRGPRRVGEQGDFEDATRGFIRHVAEGAPYRWDLLEGAKGVQLLEGAMRSWKEPRWVDLSDLPVA